MSFTDYASRSWLLDCSKSTISSENDNDVIFSDMKLSSNFFDEVLFLCPSLVTNPIFMSISSLVLKLWQFSFVKDWTEIQKWKITSSGFFPISRDWGEVGIPNLVRIYLIKSNCMLYNPMVTAIVVSELLRENQQEWGSG